MDFRIEKIQPANLKCLLDFFREHVLSDRPDIDDTYFTDHMSGQDFTFLAFWKDQPAGYLTVRGRTLHTFYRDRSIPLLHDLRVFDDYQCRGIGNALMDSAEKDLKDSGHKTVAITVGLTEFYGPAQRLYIRRHGKEVMVNEDFALSF